MERIVRQEIPSAVIDNAERVWNPETNEVRTYDAASGRAGAVVAAPREPDTRYAKLLEVFRAARAADPYTPHAPTYIARRFELHREIPEREVEALLVSVLTSKELAETAALIRARLGRPLEPEKAAWLAERIVVDPARGAGHAMGAVRREDKAHLRTRFGPDGMDYKGFNIAIHELGHNVEQVFSLNGIDHWFLNGVPNTAFTEALAFVFQGRDLELLGLDSPGAGAHHLEALDTLWGTAEIAGVALVDMAVWRWMYAHPEATPAELREATLTAARDVWNRYYAPAFGSRDEEILAIYSHMIVYGLYLPDYPLGHIIAFQVADKVTGERFGAEFERVARQGQLTPDAWMRGAVGQPISTKVLLTAARAALGAIE
jgi:hypothetical protein